MKLSEFINESLSNARQRWGNEEKFTKIVELFKSEEKAINPNVSDNTSKLGKYIEWICKNFFDPRNVSKPEDYVKYILKFDMLLNRNKIKEKRDINQYKNLEELQTSIDNLGIDIDSLKKKDEKYKVEKVFKNDKIVIISPFNHAASNHFAFGATWCTASSNPSYWKSYIDRDGGKLYYCRATWWGEGGDEWIPAWETEKRKRPLPSQKRKCMVAVLVQKNGERSYWDFDDHNFTDQKDGWLKDINFKPHDVQKYFKKETFTGEKEGRDYDIIFQNANSIVYLARKQEFVAMFIPEYFDKYYAAEDRNWNNRYNTGDELKFFTKWKPYLIKDLKTGEKFMYLIQNGYDYIKVYNSESKEIDTPAGLKKYSEKIKALGIPKNTLRSSRSITIQANKEYRTTHGSEIIMLKETDQFKVFQPKTYDAFKMYGMTSWHSRRRGSVIRDQFDLELKQQKGFKIFIIYDKVNKKPFMCLTISPDEQISFHMAAKEDRYQRWNRNSTFLQDTLAKFGLSRKDFEFTPEELWIGSAKILSKQGMSKALNRGVDPSVKDKDGKNAALIVVESAEERWNKKEILMMLKSKNVDPRIKDNKGNNILMCGLQARQGEDFSDVRNYVSEITKITSELFNETNNSGENSLHMIGKMQSSCLANDFLNVISSYEIEVSHSDNIGNTPLHIFASNENQFGFDEKSLSSILSLMQKQGFDFTKKNNDKDTVFDLIMRNGSYVGNEERKAMVVKVFEELGVKT